MNNSTHNIEDFFEFSPLELSGEFIQSTNHVISILEGTELWDGPKSKFIEFRNDCERIQQMLDDEGKEFGYSNSQLKSFRRRINDEQKRCYNIHNWWLNERRVL